MKYYINSNNQDELIFQSCDKNTNGGAALSSIEDIGIFEISEAGNVTKSEIIPLKYKLYPDELYKNNFAFQYNIWKNGNTSQYYGLYPYSNLFKQIEFINYQGKTYIFYNDHIGNLGAANKNDFKELKKINDGNGIVFIMNKQTSKKSSIFNPNEHVYFDFSSASFNEKTGIYSVICYKNDNEIYISNLSLK
jgi:hypothetical protein